MVTIFLLVLISALVIGHFFLYITRPKTTISILSQSLSEPLLFPETYGKEKEDKDVVQNEVFALKNSYKIINEKIKMAHSRLNDLERAFVLSSKPKPESSEAVIKARVNNELLMKLEKLDSFRSEAESELKDLKELVDKMKKGKLSEKDLKDKKVDSKQLNEDIHKLVFRSDNGDKI